MAATYTSTDVQKRLQALQYNIGPDGADGNIGNDTKAALSKFQHDKNIPVTGEPDPKTLGALFPESSMVQNATNSEPWYKSRIYLGLITLAVGFIANKIGVTVTNGDVATVLDVGGQIVQGLGGLYALYGRIVGSRKPAIGS